MSCMDVIVTKDSNGIVGSSPFFVTFNCPVFGKGKEERVIVEVNGKEADVSMYKDRDGEAYFCEDEMGASINIHSDSVVIRSDSTESNPRKPTVETLIKLRLKSGKNTVSYTTEDSRCTLSSRIFLWPINTRIVVTDIDGTITKSDVRGHLYSRLGKKWHHNAVVDCFQKVSSMGYKIVFLTARSLSMESVTRKYLSELELPEGPLMLSPKSLVKALHSELIVKDSKRGKLNHLKSITSLFPEDDNPVVAGFGNNENDEWAYTAAGIPKSHIFIVNKKSHITCGTGKTSYKNVATEICKFFQAIAPDLKASIEAHGGATLMLDDENV